MLIFRQLFDPESSTYSYLLGDAESREAILIDPVFEQVRRDSALITELGLELLWTLETHVHADHVTGAWLMAKRQGSGIAVSGRYDIEGADRLLDDGDQIAFGDRYLEAWATPGHTEGCMTYVLDDRSMAFTGDCLLIRGAGRTDFQGGSPEQAYRSVHERIFSLPEETLIWPGHDYRGLTVTSVAEEKAFNPRLGGELSETDFAGYMNNLGLPHPKKIDIAVPANLRCGRPEDDSAALADPDWAPLSFTFAGIWEIQPQWVYENRDKVLILDVREAEEYDGPLGHIDEAWHVPLGELPERTGELPRDKPVVAVCRAGGRSARGTQILAKAGIERYANLAGGMLRWRAQKLPVVGGAD
jgi:glyoxylase-like metal-dependent hydrolase (beta-lactamase superfamily II)/rhodanese-related sulfurtransferase